jgi:hypothetical protein
VPSIRLAASQTPSGLNASAVTSSPAPVRTIGSPAVVVGKTTSVAGRPAATARRAPSGERASARISSAITGLVSDAPHVAAARSHTRTAVPCAA